MYLPTRLPEVETRADPTEGKIRVVYGETRPAWEQTFATMREAKAFAKKHKSFGDVIFSIAKVGPGEPPQSITAALESAALSRATAIRGV